MDAPTFSTFSAISELFVTAGVIYVILRNYQGKGLAIGLAFAIIVFEFSVNMSYMITRLQAESSSGEATGPMALFAAGHGLLSLIVFIALVVLVLLAYQAFKRGRHFFQERPATTFTFLFFWMVSLISGEALYVTRYLI